MARRDLAAPHSTNEWASFDGSATTTPGEYAGWGSNMYTEPCLKMTLAGWQPRLGSAVCQPRDSWRHAHVVTKDIKYDLVVNLHYRVYSRAGIIEKHAVIENKTSQAYHDGERAGRRGTCRRATVTGSAYLNGRWAGETQLFRRRSIPA